ncbi:isocitrate lyase/phosphoenolpyruvate mutase family protein [Saxibacter everestensis]|uniref:Isocitrate lyase/phosphoenolpyruvate mutase family protein n=1 Tax=Saxibacter everestensis TaxID=2909229 RepID=A0ABY8QU38_9MICO|nr:isocitrate lyase/phosphoenolpyruvate mutase family protein [Brevibacteriaceae bacterium ZFBP1038]
MNSAAQHARVERFRELHRPGKPLLLPNAWDAASARTLAGSGFQAIGTTSYGVALSAGKPDADGQTRAETLSLARTLARLDVLATVDIEAGFSDDAEAVADLAGELARLGIAGINIEDGAGDGGLRNLDLAAAKIRAIKEAVPQLFVNARTDSYWLAGGDGDLDETLKRCRAYRDAGADGVFVPLLGGLDAIREVTSSIDAPLNVLHQPDGPRTAELAAAGVARISSGSHLFRTAMAAMTDAMAAIGRGDVS